MLYSSEHPTPPSWSTSKITAACAITFCAPNPPRSPDSDASLTRFSALNYVFRSIGFAGECLGQHSGSDQEANLGDGHGFRAFTIALCHSTPSSSYLFSIYPKKKVNETAVIRWDYGDPTLGTCKETVEGGNHLRYWTQTGSEANRCGLLALTDDRLFTAF